MRYRIEVDGRVVECESPQDAIALVRALSNGSSSSRRERSPRPITRRESENQTISFPALSREGKKQLRDAVELLEKVEKAGDTGVAVSELAAHAGITQPRGLGVFTTMCNKYLIDGLRFQDATSRERGADGIKRWKPTAKTAKVVAQLKSVLSPR